ncbi:DUF4097 domain-containing protein [Draconibacterium sp.]|nr:DUF4097 domain-containing protein [Draconibacterium sp.]
MMSKFKLITVLVIISILAVEVTAVAEEKTKEFYESWGVTSIQSLDITNKFGEIRVTDERTDSVTIEVTITVEARDENKADDLLEMLEVEFKKSGSTLYAVTKIENNFQSQRKFSIDYVVNIPSDKNLKISNKYGHTIVNKLTGNGDFDIQYGNFNANSLTGESTKINLGYGNADVREASAVTAQVKYSPISFGEIKELKLESKYSDIEVEEGKVIQIESKYDKLRFEEVESVTATTKYSHIRIEELAKSLNIEAGYGSVKVDEVNSTFESISITNSYGQVSLGLEDNYSVDASCQYCGVSYPENDFSGDRIKENNTQTIKGKVGSGSGGKVYVRSRYGEINLRN